MHDTIYELDEVDDTIDAVVHSDNVVVGASIHVVIDLSSDHPEHKTETFISIFKTSIYRFDWEWKIMQIWFHRYI